MSDTSRDWGDAEEVTVTWNDDELLVEYTAVFESGRVDSVMLKLPHVVFQGLQAVGMATPVRSRRVGTQRLDRRIRAWRQGLSDDPGHEGCVCAACAASIDAGEWAALIPLGPGLDPALRALAADGHHFDAVTVRLHWACATGEEEPFSHLYVSR